MSKKVSIYFICTIYPLLIFDILLYLYFLIFVQCYVICTHDKKSVYIFDMYYLTPIIS